MTFSVWVEGVEELNKLAADIGGSGQRMGAKGAMVLRKSTFDIEAIAKQFAPVDTGNLRDSIGPPVFTGDGRSASMEGVVESHANYSVFPEYGTVKMAPRAYMGPAFDRVAPNFLAALEKIADPLD
jgi:HK97 gp10 family phage protein